MLSAAGSGALPTSLTEPLMVPAASAAGAGQATRPTRPSPTDRTSGASTGCAWCLRLSASASLGVNRDRRAVAARPSRRRSGDGRLGVAGASPRVACPTRRTRGRRCRRCDASPLATERARASQRPGTIISAVPWPASCPIEPAFSTSLRRGRLAFVYREVLADSLTPVSAFARLGRGPYSFLLESVVGGEKWAAYSFARRAAARGVPRPRRGRSRSCAPRATASWWPSAARRPIRSPPWARCVRELPAAVPPGLPRFFGGAVGWLGYDAVRWFERLPERAPDELGLPEACFALTDTVVIFDNLRGTIKVVASVDVGAGDPDRAYDDACARIEAVLDRLAAPGAAAAPARRRRRSPPPPARAASRARRASATRPTCAGSRSTSRPATPSRWCSRSASTSPAGASTPSTSTALLRVTNPSPYMFHLEFPEAVVTGASPECLVRLDGRTRRGAPHRRHPPRAARTPEEDAALEAELRADEKERAEHVMLIDLGRNDVGRVAAPGHACASTRRMVVERYSHVMHLVSNVSGTLADGQGRRRRGARGLPGRHAVRRAQDPGHGDHRGARAGAPRASTAARSATCRTRATPTWPSPSAPWSPAATPSTCRPAPASSPTAGPTPSTRSA